MLSWKILVSSLKTGRIKWTTETDDNMRQNLTDSVLNTEISIEELNRALKSTKANKATGKDNFPNEILKCERLMEFILKLFQKCFESGTLPNMWDLSVIHPILKKERTIGIPLVIDL